MSCVPCPCDLFRIDNPINCTAINTTFTDPPRLGQLYSGIYSFASFVPEIIEGIPEMIQSDLTSFVVKFGLTIGLLWLIMFIILFIIMARNNLVTYQTTVVLILIATILTILALLFVYYDTRNIVNNFNTQIRETISDNWDTKKNEIVPDILESYLSCSYCDSETFGCSKSCGGVCINACNNTTPKLL